MTFVNASELLSYQGIIQGFFIPTNVCFIEFGKKYCSLNVPKIQGQQGYQAHQGHLRLPLQFRH